MANTSDFRKGSCIKLDGNTFSIVDFQHVKPGKGPAFVRTTLKNLYTKKVISKTFTSGVKIEFVRIEKHLSQFLYKDSSWYHIMDSQTLEVYQIAPKRILSSELLIEGQEQIELLINSESGEILECKLPPLITLKVTYTEPGYRGDTVNRALKDATLETGYNIKVPLFININDFIKVDTRTKSYVERVNK